MNFWKHVEERQPASEDDIRDAERRLGVKLPRAFVSLFRTSDGGVPANETFTPCEPISADEDDLWPLEIFYALEEIEDLESIGQLGWAPDDSFEGYIDNPELLIVFSSLGGKFWCLDYRQCGPDKEPGVQFVYADYTGEPRVVPLAGSFDTFLDGLHGDDE